MRSKGRSGRHRHRPWRLATVAVLALLGLGSKAVQAGDVDVFGQPVEIHGFVSQGFLLTTGNDYLAPDTTDGSFELSEVGLNFTTQLSDRLRAGMQLFSRDLGFIGNYKASFDWYYLDYRWKDWLSIRVGRVKLPFGLYNDSSDIDAARTAILLPPSMYPQSSRDYLLAVTGGDVYGYVVTPSAGAFAYDLYGGTIFVPFQNNPANPLKILDVRVPYVAGGRLMWETPLDGLRVGASVQGLELDTNDLNTLDGSRFSIDISAILAVASAEYQHQDLLLAAEYSRWFAEIDSTFPGIASQSQVEERGYVLGSYRFLPWFQVGAYYSLYYPNVDHRNDGRAGKQRDAAATLRFDIDPHWLFKLEGHYFHGTAGLSADVNDGTPVTELQRDWSAFLAKTTAYF